MDSSHPPCHVLVVDDDSPTRKGLQELLGTWGYDAAAAADGVDALRHVANRPPDVVLADLVMPRLDGLALLAELRREHPGIAVIVLTGQGTVETAVQAMKDGAYDYLAKPVDLDRLRVLLQRAVEQSETIQELTRLRRELRRFGAFGQMIAGAPTMQEITRQLELVAVTDATVLVAGESGTGKELVARTIHGESRRKRGPFVAVNCAAIPDTLFESEIFGHEKGAFTGATARRQGCFELADGGTLFLDEVAEMQSSTQAKLLRVLQEGRLRRVGGGAEISVDVRVIAATNKDPVKAVQDGALREDLYYRLNVFSVALPPLRERLSDLPELVGAFLAELNERHGRALRGLDDASLGVFRGYAWPGNVRELRNVLERAVILCPGDLIGVEHLPTPPAPPRLEAVRAAEPSGEGISLPVGTTVDEAERQLILRTLRHVGNNKTRAAQMLGIGLKTLYNKLSRYKP